MPSLSGKVALKIQNSDSYRTRVWSAFRVLLIIPYCPYLTKITFNGKGPLICFLLHMLAQIVFAMYYFFLFFRFSTSAKIPAMTRKPTRIKIIIIRSSVVACKKSYPIPIISSPLFLTFILTCNAVH